MFFRSNSSFCQDGVFTITTDFNNGALRCQCDIDGSLSFDCARFGGQCQCRENIIGRQCSRCEEGYYGFPRCVSKYLIIVKFFLAIIIIVKRAFDWDCSKFPSKIQKVFHCKFTSNLIFHSYKENLHTVNTEFMQCFYYCKKCERIVIAIFITLFANSLVVLCCTFLKSLKNKFHIIITIKTFAIINACNNFWISVI